MAISSRTPEGEPNRCPLCGSAVKVDPSADTRDAPCPCCGHLLWFTRPATPDAGAAAQLAAEEARLAVDRLIRVGTRRLGPPDRATALVLCAIPDSAWASVLERQLLRARSWDEVFALAWDAPASATGLAGAKSARP